VVLLWMGGCRPSKQTLRSSEQGPLVWPPPPERARIAYVGEISTEGDLARKRRPRLVELLFGKKDMGVLLAPSAVTVNPAGQLLVADRMGRVVHVFDVQTKAYRQFSKLTDDQTLQSPVALTLVGEKVYVVDSLRHEVCVFDQDGSFRLAFGGERLKRPSGIAYLSTTREIYVADTAAHNLKVFHPDGGYLRTVGARGGGSGRFNFPTHLWADDEGHLFVSDTLNYRIQVLTQSGTFVQGFGSHGDRPGSFGHPCGVATDREGHVYVADRQFENIQVFDRFGRVLLAFGQEGSDAGEFWLPSGLFIDARNRIYVADTYNKRIQIFRLLEDTPHAP
jgi:DNA-binding beta-propeller fold protein YncE